jgi:hypothetical protein
MGIIDHIIDRAIWGEIFNGSAPKHPAKEEYYVQAAKQLNIDPPTFDKAEQSYKVIDSSKIIEQFDYKFKYLDPFEFPL